MMDLDAYIEKINAILYRYPTDLNFISSVSFEQEFHKFIAGDIEQMIKDGHLAMAFTLLMYLAQIPEDYHMHETSYQIHMNEVFITILSIYRQGPIYIRHLIYMTLTHTQLKNMNEKVTKTYNDLVDTIRKSYGKEQA